jgi:RNA polymerase sigma-70 factor (ECF subfamily)
MSIMAEPRTAVAPIGGVRAPSTSQAAKVLGGPDEAEFVSRLKARHDGAFDQLALEVGDYLFAVARRIMGNDQDAMDAVQDVFVNVWRRIDQFDGRSKLTTWLHRATVNACLMKLRTQRRRHEQPIEPMLPTFREDGHNAKPAGAWRDPPLVGIEGRELRALVRDKIAELPESYRLVLMLRDIEGLDTEEAATVLQVTPNACKLRLHRARQALRELLEPFMRDPASGPAGDSCGAGGPRLSPLVCC